MMVMMMNIIIVILLMMKIEYVIGEPTFGSLGSSHSSEGVFVMSATDHIKAKGTLLAKIIIIIIVMIIITTGRMIIIIIIINQPCPHMFRRWFPPERIFRQK